MAPEQPIFTNLQVLGGASATPVRPLAVRSYLSAGSGCQTLRLEGDRATFRRTLCCPPAGSAGERPVEPAHQPRVASHRA